MIARSAPILPIDRLSYDGSVLSDPTRNARAVTAYFTGINAERYADVAAMFAPHGELRAPGSGPRRGAEIAAYFTVALAGYPEHLDVPGRVLHSGDSATVEIHFTGRTGSGFEIEFDAIDVFDFDAESQILRLTSWYDSHAVRQLLRRSREAAVEPT